MDIGKEAIIIALLLHNLSQLHLRILCPRALTNIIYRPWKAGGLEAVTGRALDRFKLATGFPCMVYNIG